MQQRVCELFMTRSILNAKPEAFRIRYDRLKIKMLRPLLDRQKRAQGSASHSALAHASRKRSSGCANGPRPPCSCPSYGQRASKRRPRHLQSGISLGQAHRGGRVRGEVQGMSLVDKDGGARGEGPTQGRSEPAWHTRRRRRRPLIQSTRVAKEGSAPPRYDASARTSARSRSPTQHPSNTLRPLTFAAPAGSYTRRPWWFDRTPKRQCRQRVSAVDATPPNLETAEPLFLDSHISHFTAADNISEGAGPSVDGDEKAPQLGADMLSDQGGGCHHRVLIGVEGHTNRF